ncbi:MAG: CoA pyrophosphatase [Desulfarculus sp.]|nr:CoA pyrophosphatase [Desulfarculus sp.]
MTELLQHTAQALSQALAGHQPQRLEHPGSRPAAVLMPLWESEGRVQVVFTKRNATLPHHPGQISFPGGAADPGDADLAETALRETCEEIGVCQGLVEVVERLDQVLTITNFLVTPYVGLVDARADFRPNPVEVARLVVVPLATVLARESYQLQSVSCEGVAMRQLALARGVPPWPAGPVGIMLNPEPVGCPGRKGPGRGAGGGQRRAKSGGQPPGPRVDN